MSDSSIKLVDWLIRAAAALIPMLLAALVTLAWTNSHRISVMTSDIEDLDREILHLRQLVESKLITPPNK